LTSRTVVLYNVLVDAIENPARFFRSLRGAPAAVLLVLAFSRRPMTNTELQEWSGFGHNEVTRALRLLTDLRWVEAYSSRGPWVICASWQLPRSQDPTVRGPDDAVEPWRSAEISLESSQAALENASGQQLPGRGDAGKNQMPPAAARPPIPRADLLTLLQSLKGAPASVLLALSANGQPMSNQELQLWTRYSHPQITLALRSLGERRWVVGRSSRGPWFLADDAQVPGINCLLGAFEKVAPDGSSAIPRLAERKDSLPNATKMQLLQALHESGIYEPTASELAALPHVTVEYVRGHVAAASADGLRVGAAIARMRLAEPVPLTPPKAKSRTELVEEQIRRFLEDP